jgi:hypothetical protein
MKKIYLSFITFFSVCQFTFAQWTPGTGIITTPNSVGIGTTTPTASLSITPSSTGLTNEATNFLGGTGSVLGNSAGSYLFPFEFQHTNYTNTDRLQIAPYRRISGTGWLGTAYRLQFAVDNSFTDGSKGFIEVGASDPTVSGGGFISLGTAGTDRLSILNNGNVGIGTTTPSKTLNVDPQGAGGMLIGNSNGGSGGYTCLFLTISAAQNGYSAIQSIQSAGSLYGNLLLNQNGGNILIGETTQNNPTYKLDVGGSIRANTIVVNTDGADFVFEPAYKLSSLSNLKKYIDNNHHLPEIPSAKQMQAAGLNLGDNQIKLLQKVEELTLYTITSDKEIKDEKSLVAKQQALLLQQQTQLNVQQKQIEYLNEQVQALIKALKK